MEYNHLKHMWTVYQRAVVSYAKVMFEAKVKPFCESRGWIFTTGNGTWWIGPPGEDSWNWWDHKDDKEWQEIASLLTSEVPGMDYNDFGSLMPSLEANNGTK